MLQKIQSASPILVLALLAGLLPACGGGTPAPPPDSASPGAAADAYGFTAPTAATLAVLRDAAAALPEDERDVGNAARGLIASAKSLRIDADNGDALWEMSAYDFLAGDDNAGTIHPSLLRQARLNNGHGLFEVVPGIYQLRGFDLSNMTLIDGASGWIVVDPLTSRETAAAALAFARSHLPSRPVSAVLFTHSHVDHFGGVLGVVSPEEVAQRSIPIVAPDGFLEEALKENVAAGVAMARRATYMYGRGLPRGPRGHVDSGLGKSPAIGRLGILEPTMTIDRTGQEQVIDGVRFVFQNAPGSEAPAEFTFYLPELNAYCGAEVVSHTLHNLYTLRGAKVRDALAWSGYIDEARRLFGNADVVFNSHHWPVWGNQEVLDYLADQRDLYKAIHDQTLRLLNAGASPGEIADQLTLPDALTRRYANRGYYGTVRHNARAVYQNYLGWYDGNPANLNPLPPVDSATRYVAAIGGANALLSQAREDYARGDYRWVAELVNHLVMAEPDNDAARELLAATYDQLGYQSESAPWRDVYLSAAYELRHGIMAYPSMLESAADMLRHMPLENFFVTLATRLDMDKAADKVYRIRFSFTDLDRAYLLEVRHGVLHHRISDGSEEVDATMAVTHDLYLQLATGRIGIIKALAGDEMSVTGSKLKLAGFFRLFDEPDGNFAIVTP